jgi:hypothetical protein
MHPSSAVAVTRKSVAARAASTKCFSPSSMKPSFLARAETGLARFGCAGSFHAGIATTLPDGRPAPKRVRSFDSGASARSTLANAEAITIGSATSARPSASLRTACSRMPRPAPPI